MTTELQKSPQVDMKGFLLRYETFKGRSGWKKRWAVLCDFCLYLYKEQTSKECFYALLLPNSRVTQSHDSSGQYRSSIKVEEVNQQPVYLSTETPLDFQLWFEALASAAQMQRLQPEQQQVNISFAGGGQLLQGQQFGSSSQSQAVVTTSQTTTSRVQQQQQQRDSLGGGGVEVVTRNHQYNYRDENGGGGGDANAHASVRLSQPTLATAEGQYNFRQQYEMQQPPQRAASTTATAPLDEIKRKYPVSGLAKRMSIAASDLLGKSHDELLLLLIQLNREKASLERRRDYYLALLRHQPDMRGADRMQAELREIDNQIELHDPLITFINNIISMGSLYSGDDVMFASEYRQHLLQPGELKPVKANVGFLRKQQERDVARQFSNQSGLDSVDADIIASAPESREFSVTRQQLEAELNELETVYAEHRRKKTNLAAFMSDLGKRAAGASSGKSFVSISSVAGSGVSGGGSYLETDLDTGASVDLAAKFPQRRTAVPRGSSSASASTGAVRVQQQKSKTMPSKTHDANGVPLRSAVSLDRRVVGSVSDEVFEKQQQQRQQQQFSSPTQRGGYEFTTITSTSRTLGQQGGAEAAMRDDFQPRQQQQQQNYGISVETNRSSTAGPSGGGGGRIPDPDEFLRTRATLLSSGASGSGLPPGHPPPEVYMSQPQLHQVSSSRGGGGSTGGSHTISMQEKLNLALGIDTLDSGPSQRSAPVASASAALGTGTKKPLITLDSNRYKRNTNFSTDLHGDHRDEALDNLGQFVEDTLR
uniref:PH domain-containing protein n=1 Tax=Macrostomum lignano TaxID=282301 RepID=A0A1I8HSB0_9PLAT